MNKLKNKKGITLIALVITIIVLLILAGVSISMLTGDNGILTKASDAKEKSESAEAEELVRLAVLASYGIDGEIELGELKKNLGKIEKIEEIGDINSLPKDVTVNGQVLTITEDGDVEEGIAEDGKELIEKNRTLAGTTTGYSYKNPVIPQGFYPVNTKTSKWKYKDSEKNEVEGWNEGLVISDEAGNEFVWVPCTVETEKTEENVAYVKNYNYRSNYSNPSSSNTTDDISAYPETITDENQQIKTYKGFYVARYEAGYTEATNIKNPTIPNNNGSIVPVSKKGTKVLNYIEYANAVASAKLMINYEEKYGNNKSGLITGTQWDTIMDWYNESGIGVRDVKTAGDIYPVQDWGTYRNLDYNGIGNYFIFDKVSGASSWLNKSFIHQGTTTAVSTSIPNHYHASGINNKGIKKNIADLGGNLWEWTAEKNSSNCVLRGGGAGNNCQNDNPVSVRASNNNSTYTGCDFGFRCVLYII